MIVMRMKCVRGNKVILIFMKSLEHETMMGWESHGFGRISCMHNWFLRIFLHQFMGVWGYGLALTLMVMTGL